VFGSVDPSLTKWSFAPLETSLRGCSELIAMRSGDQNCQLENA